MPLFLDIQYRFFAYLIPLLGNNEIDHDIPAITGRYQALSVHMCEVITVDPKYSSIPCLMQICL